MRGRTERRAAADQPQPVIVTMKRRRQFLAAARGRRAVRPGFVLQARARAEDPDGPVQVGFTASRKVGKAVIRNRAKRRLRALAADVLANLGRPGWDYVLIARADATVRLKFALLAAQLETAVAQVHAARGGRRPAA